MEKKKKMSLNVLENLHCFSLILSAIWRIDFIALNKVIVGQIWLQTKIKVSIGPQVCSSVFIRPLFCASCTVHLCSFYPTDQEQPQVLPCTPRCVPTEGVASQRQQFPQSSLQSSVWALITFKFCAVLVFVSPVRNLQTGTMSYLSRRLKRRLCMSDWQAKDLSFVVCLVLVWFFVCLFVCFCFVSTVSLLSHPLK